MASYLTLDYLPDLTISQIGGARSLSFSPYTASGISWDNRATVSGSEPYALLHDIYRFTAKEGATYDLFSTSFFDPYILMVYDQFGNAIVANSESDDPSDVYLGDGYYGRDVIWSWVAPYTGTYYVSASWHQGSYYTYYSLSIYEDVNTAAPPPPPPPPPPPAPAAPVITSNGGGATATVSVPENTTAVTTVTATDANNDALNYSLTGGADRSAFTINAGTGSLSFASAPNFEAPADSDKNNSYLVEVTVSDGKGGIDLQALTVLVTDVAENVAPIITSNGGGATSIVNVPENTTAVTTVTATDANSDALSYSLTGGADRSAFTINASTGDLSFTSAARYAAPTDSDKNNSYLVEVTVSDGKGGTDLQALTVNVSDGVDTILGDAGANDLIGTTGVDILRGLGGNDVLSGLSGNDTLDGGSGIDTALVAGKRSLYSLLKTGSNWTLSGLPTGTDALIDMERISFSDTSVALDLAVGQSAATATLLASSLLGAGAISNKPLMGLLISYFDGPNTLADGLSLLLQAGVVRDIAGGNSNAALIVAIERANPSATTDAQTLSLADQLRAEAISPLAYLQTVVLSAASQANVGLTGLARTGLEYA